MTSPSRNPHVNVTLSPNKHNGITFLPSLYIPSFQKLAFFRKQSFIQVHISLPYIFFSSPLPFLKSAMDNQERKPPVTDDNNDSRKQAQVHSDFIIAMALHHQETRASILPTITNDDEEETELLEDTDDDQDSNEYLDNDYEFFEMEFGEEEEGQGSNNEDEDEEDEMMEEDEIDPDELSYEELIALGEMIGEEKRGLGQNEIANCLKLVKLETTMKKKNKMMEKCVICQMEYEEGEEELVGLPSCDHVYHSECITKWLQVRKICPICTTEVSLSSPAVGK